MTAPPSPQLLTGGGLTAFVVPVQWLALLVPPTPCYALEAAALYPKALGLLDGPMFGFCAGEPHSYPSYQCGATQTALHDGWTGATQRGSMPRAGGTLVRRGSRATVVSGLPDPATLSGADLVLQARPELVRDGVVVASASIDGDATRRAAVALLGPDVAALVVSRPMGNHAFAVALQRLLGATEALYTDGGGSTELLVAGRPVGGTTGRSRRVPSFVAAIDPSLRNLGL